MSDETGIVAVASEIAKNSGSVMVEAYKDLLQRPLRAVSSIAAPPLESLARCVARIFGEKDPASLRPPPAHIMGPVAIGFVLSQDSDELRSMYAKLLASAMSEDEPHPSFADVIRQLSPIDARLLRQLKEKGFGVQEGLFRRLGAKPPFIDFNDQYLGSAVDISYAAEGREHLLFGMPQDNLRRLGIIDCVEELRDQFINTPDRLKLRRELIEGAQERFPEFREALSSVSIQKLRMLQWASGDLPANRDFHFSSNLVHFTEFGRAFVSATIPGDEWTW